MQARYAIGIIVIVVLGALLWFKAPQIEQVADRKLQVVTTFVPLYSFTKNVTGDYAEVLNLLPNGVSPHDYSFTPADVLKLSRADVVVKQGRGFDDWIDEVIRAAGRTDLVVITASENIIPFPGIASDPHLWLDPVLAAQEVERIRDGLTNADPINREYYELRAEEYILKLLDLDREVRRMLADLPRRDFVSFHPAFRYFAHEYGLREVGVIEDVPGKEPSPQELVRLVEGVRRARVEVIFSEPQFSPKIVELLARDYGLRIAELDPLETGEFRADYYEEIIRKNVATLVRAFQ